MYYNIARGQISRGCDMCLLGSKSVIFITGLCPLDCFYCPVSRERFGRDVIYVNDIPVTKAEEVVAVVASFASDGAAITGGDPSVVAERVHQVSRALKTAFGPGFHIHMYTHVLNLNSRRVGVLAASEVDEVRVHATDPIQVKGRERYLRALVAAGKTVGLEVPAVPGLERRIVEVIELLADLVDFVNINELDASEANLERLLSAGYRVEGSSVAGSLEAARRIAESVSVPVHICRTRTKDLVQIGARLYRYAMSTSMPHEEVLDDGSVRSGEGGHPRDVRASQVRVRLKLGPRVLEL